MDQALAFEILISGENALLTGPAGSGKTYVLNQFIRHAKKSGKKVAVTATTGLAATHLGGNTIHSWSGIGIKDSISPYLIADMPKSRIETIRTTDVLIIDEISMLHDFRLDMIDQIARRVRDDDNPFGGLQVVLCGDFFQLPPINRAGGVEGTFVVNADVWESLDLVVCYLDEQHRQNDDTFLEILTALRSGEIRRHHAETLLGRRDIEVGEATELHTNNIDVDYINSKKLSELPGKEHHYTMNHTGQAHYVENLKKSCLAVETLVLKEGALVMCIKNSPERRYVNGSLGVVVGFDKESDYPIIELKNGRRLTIIPDTWELRDGDKKRAGLVQLPLRLAWAITVHKSQGMTLDAARVDLTKAFVEGMGYVALSRVRSLDTLSLQGINQMALRVSPEALEIDKTLRHKSAKYAKKFEHLRVMAKNRKLKPLSAKKAKTSNWNDKLAKMRLEYPNAYRPWKKEDDEKLVKLFSGNKPVLIKELTKKFGRHPGSIRSRLIKHFGEDAIK
ncbi:hypothetical protein A3F37_01315 [Candidatus Saccharibacteria bacterium RIFCSPHIGHO2_12_FULL_41_12]|nr:MAG: hypothetical protein A3F37_01315 [Candidatus Saccharibacteria bacterium RIFCSPHIGHO2_12_FULL_41_12]